MIRNKSVLIVGAGGHAQDIHATMGERWWTGVDHHKNIRPFSHAGPVLIAINDPQVRAAVAKELGVADETWVHPRAFVGPDCRFGDGVHVNSDAWMTRVSIGDHCTIAPHAVILGDVVVGDRVFVGANATIRNRVTIGDDVTIGMGAVVTCDVTEGQTVVGNPARPV